MRNRRTSIPNEGKPSAEETARKERRKDADNLYKKWKRIGSITYPILYVFIIAGLIERIIEELTDMISKTASLIISSVFLAIAFPLMILTVISFIKWRKYKKQMERDAGKSE